MSCFLPCLAFACFDPQAQATAEEADPLDEEAAQSWDMFRDEDEELLGGAHHGEAGGEVGGVGEGEGEGMAWDPDWGEEGDWNAGGAEGQGEEGVAGSQGDDVQVIHDELHEDDLGDLRVHHEDAGEGHGEGEEDLGHPKGGVHDPGLHDEYPYEYDDYVDEKMWDDEDWTEGKHEAETDFVGVDAHLLCTPVRPLSFPLKQYGTTAVTVCVTQYQYQ